MSNKRADVGAVHVGVGEQHHLVIASLLNIEFLTDAGADGRDQRLDLGVLQRLGQPRLFNVDDLAPDREDRLGLAVTTLFGRPGGAIALDDEQLTHGCVARRTIGELARQTGRLEHALAPGQLPCLSSRQPGAGGHETLVGNGPAFAAVPLQPFGKETIERLFHIPANLGVTQLGLGLAFELGRPDFDRNHGGQPFPGVLAGEVLVLFLEQSLGPGEIVDRPGQRLAESLFVGTALVGVDVVGEAQHRLGIGRRPLHRHFNLGVFALIVEVDDVGMERILGRIQVFDVIDQAALVEESDSRPVLLRARRQAGSPVPD